MNLTQLSLAMDFSVIVIAESYYLESYNSVYYREFVFEFPAHHILQYRVNQEVLKINDKSSLKNFDPSITKIFYSEMIILGMLVLIMIINLVAAKIQKKSVFLKFIGEFIFIIFAQMGNIFFFEFYKKTTFELDNIGYIKEQANYEKMGRTFYILLFVIQSLRTLTSGFQNFEITTMLWTTKFILNWIFPLVFFYTFVILMLTFLAEVGTYTFTDKFYINLINIIQIICQTNVKKLELLLLESPNWFIFIITALEIVIFYFINNIYFGLQFENVRLLTDSRENNYKQKGLDGKVKDCSKMDQQQGFFSIVVSSCGAMCKKIGSNEGDMAENKDAEETVINTKKR